MRPATTPSWSPQGRLVPRDLPIPGRDPLGRALRHGVPPRPAEQGGRRRTRSPTRSPPRASTSSSSAAATPAPTASAPPTARARCRCARSRSCLSRLVLVRRTIRGRPGRVTLHLAAAHEEGGQRLYSLATSSFVDSGRGSVAALAVDSVRYVDGRFEVVSGARRGSRRRPRAPRARIRGTRARWCRRGARTDLGRAPERRGRRERT